MSRVVELISCLFTCFDNKRNNNTIPLGKVRGWFWNGGEISLINEPAILLTEWNRRQTSKHRDETSRTFVELSQRNVARSQKRSALLNWKREKCAQREKGDVAQPNRNVCFGAFTWFLSGTSLPPLLYGRIVSSKGGISKFLSKGLFFYYLLNFQTFSNFGGKKRKHVRNVSAIIPSCFVCDEVVL